MAHCKNNIIYLMVAKVPKKTFDIAMNIYISSFKLRESEGKRGTQM